MIRRALLAFAFAALCGMPVLACPSPLTGKDGAGTSQNFGVTLDGSSNCYGNVALVDGSNAANKAAVLGSGADATSNSTGGLAIYGFGMQFNGTTWDRIRGDTTNGLWANIKTSVLPTGAATSANQSTEITALQAIQTSAATTATNTGAAVPAGTNTIGNVGTITPAGATAITASATGTTAATTATLAASVGKTTFMCWMSIRANATAAATGNATVTGTITGTLNFTQWTAPNASGLGVTEMIFNPCVPGSATNTAIAIISAAPGTGGVVSVSAGGYQM